ncbi:MAG TPA: nucleotidyltransferase family protein [Bacteroidota bacterium]|nr:nucleotidyltransferase family protein [Bacteroidota bacterium]
MIDAVILAAGASARMGRDKALLTLEGSTFIRRIIRLYTGAPVGGIVVVLGPDSGKVQNEISAEDVVVVENLNAEGGQISSLIVGIESLENSGSDGILVHPVDHPMVSPATIPALVNAASANAGRIILPVCGGRRGHPVLFPASMFQELKDAPVDTGARAVVRAHAPDILEVRTDDRGILINIDTEEEYERIQRNLRGPS